MRRGPGPVPTWRRPDRKSTRLNSSHLVISYAVFCLKKKKQPHKRYIDQKKEELVHPRLAQRHLAAYGFSCTHLVGGDRLAGLGHHGLLFFVNDTATTEIYTLSLHDALPI